MIKEGATNGMVPLCVDMDGTAIKTDSLFEALLQLLKKNPFMALMIPLITVSMITTLISLIQMEITIL